MVSTTTSYTLISNNLTRSLETKRNEPQVNVATEYYLENIGNIKTVDDFLNDYRIFDYALKAYGLEDMTYAKAFMRKVLTEGVEDKESFANKLTDERYKKFAEAFNFAKDGENATQATSAQSGTVDKYVRQALEKDAGADNEGVRLALYFERNADTITDAYSLLADKALAEVVRTALGISAESASMDIDAQARMIKKNIDLEDFKDPEKLKTFLIRFTAAYEATNGSTTATNAILVDTSSKGISSSLLMTLQNLRLGGN